MAKILKVLIDLNVILDVLQQRDPFYATSARVLAAAERGQIRAYIAAHTVTTLFYLVSKDRSARQARTILMELLQFIDIAAVTQETIEQALVLPMSDFEDAVQLAASMQCGGDYLVTRNVKDYPQVALTILQPAELLTLL